MKSFADSDFLVVFSGESPSARLIRGWDRVLAYLDYEATNRTEEESYRNPENTLLHDPDSWSLLGNTYTDNGGDERFEFHEPVGEMSAVTITRLTEPINQEWLPINERITCPKPEKS